MGFKVPSNPNHCVILILDEELPLCPLSLSHLPVLSQFPVLLGKAGASCAALSNYCAFISWLFVMEMPNGTIV